MIAVWIFAGLLLIGLIYVSILYLIVKLSLKPIRIPVYMSPGSFGCPQESVRIESDLGFPIPGWWVEGEGKVVALHLHGYVMNRCELVPTAVWLHNRGIGSLLIDFGGHGTAVRPGTTIGWNERKEVLSCLKYIRERCPDAKIMIIGSSMGSAAGAFALGDDSSAADALVLDSSYSDLTKAVRGWWRLFGPPWLGKVLSPIPYIAKPVVGYDAREVDVTKALSKSNVPVLVLHGDRDGIATPDQAHRNIEVLGDRAETVWFKGCRHSEGRWLYPDEYYKALDSFLVRLGWT